MPTLLSGLVAAPFTPLSPDGAVNLGPIGEYANHLCRDGVEGAFICGTTGEGASLTSPERMQVAAAWCESKPDKLKVIVHVGHNSNAESCALAKHAAEIGAEAIATLAPSFFRISNREDLLAWCEPIAAAAPDLPFYYYHMPSMAGADFAMADALPLLAAKIPSFAGIKYTHDNLFDYNRTLAAANGRYAVLAGRDEILLSYLAFGAAGAVGSTYNYAAPLYQQLLAAYRSGDMASARKWQGYAQATVAVIMKHGGMAANKAIMSLISGIDCGPVRLPLRSLNPDQVASVRQDLKLAGLYGALQQAAALGY